MSSRSRSFRNITPKRLGQIWSLYTDFKRPQLAPSTIERDYHKVSRVIARMPASLGTAIEIRDWLLVPTDKTDPKHGGGMSAESTRRLLMQFNACGRWAVTSQHISANPFEGLSTEIKRKQNPTVWKAFNLEERNLIIHCFEVQKPFYAPWVKFLFFTGCRPEEARALRWEKITADFSQILIDEAHPVDIDNVQSTKNYTERVFPCNPRLQAILKAIAPQTRKPEALVFQGAEGGLFEYHNFQTRHWKPLVEKLATEGKILRSLSQYHCRHTFATLMEGKLKPSEIAYLLGDRLDTVQKYYTDRPRGIEVPED